MFISIYILFTKVIKVVDFLYLYIYFVQTDTTNLLSR